MIAGEARRGKFVIATPTKCGTTTMEALARRHARQHDNVGPGQIHRSDFMLVDWEKPRRQHRMVPPTGWHNADRVLLVRNPYARYVSVYEYLRGPANYSQWGAKKVQGRTWPGHADNPWGDDPPLSFEDFLSWMADMRSFLDLKKERTRRGKMHHPAAYRSPWVWTDSLTQSLDFLKRTPGRSDTIGFLRLENLWDELRVFCEAYGVVGLDLSPLHSNRTTKRHTTDGVEVTSAVKGDSLVWQAYYGSEHSICIPGVRSSHCVYRDRWEGDKCGVCRLHINREATRLGYAA
jgi:hypothetical protein